MEYCLQVQIIHFSDIEDSLIKNLQILHALNIVHLDIKPENICFSQEWKKTVFVDYGFHKVIKEDLGFKTFTNFRGSMTFCSQEMLECFETR